MVKSCQEDKVTFSFNDQKICYTTFKIKGKKRVTEMQMFHI